MKEYSVILLPDPEEGGFTVTVPALPGITTEGDTEEEALANARDAIELYLQSLAELGEAAPSEMAHARLVTVRVSSPAA
ncbi:MAG: type II toxin-antitoxin system HicB family antitoxin [Chloroflexi bacterium]|nr:type II toxin-antitoxin system HicB family antitoxin [Chloroflexota bacterium]